MARGKTVRLGALGKKTGRIGIFPSRQNSSARKDKDGIGPATAARSAMVSERKRRMGGGGERRKQRGTG